MALTDLHVRRSGPFLYLCRPTPEAANTVWASLKFTAIECMLDIEPSWQTAKRHLGLVVYHCTFLSLRSHDSTRHVRNNLDHDLAEEKSHFAGSVFPPYMTSKLTNRNSAIRDSGYKHALRLYRDRTTDALRLEASVLKGEMEKYAHFRYLSIHS